MLACVPVGDSKQVSPGEDEAEFQAAAATVKFKVDNGGERRLQK